ncbi:MAG: hypothetical protein V4628_11595 [Pseudomonadota bacterium]
MIKIMFGVLVVLVIFLINRWMLKAKQTPDWKKDELAEVIEEGEALEIGEEIAAIKNKNLKRKLKIINKGKSV